MVYSICVVTIFEFWFLIFDKVGVLFWVDDFVIDRWVVDGVEDGVGFFNDFVIFF